MPSGDGLRTLYGRDQQVEELLRVRVSVRVIGGDSGVGKTRVLEEVAGRFDGLAPTPVRVGNSPAALQAGLLEAVGAAVAAIASDEGAARRMGKLLVDGGRRLARVKANEIGVAVARIILGVVRDRVGSNLTDVLTEYLEQVRDATTDDLASRIRRAADPDVIHAIAELAGEVAAAAGGRRVLLSLDDIHHLNDDDRGRLMDLGPILPDAVSVACAFTSDSRADESVLDQYRLAGITVYPLYGLDLWAVKQWLAAEDLDAGMAEEVWHRTNGYGLVVADAIQMFKAGKNLTDAFQGGREELMRAATREALRELDPSAHVAALKLSLLPRPMPTRYTAAYLEADPVSWAVTEGSLIDSHIFVAGDPPWFHDQRRVLLREQVRDSDLVPYLKAVAAQLIAFAQEAEAPADALIQYAGINDELVSLGVADSALFAVAQLDDDALVVLGALIELTEGNSQGVDTEQALLYARRTFGASGDLPTALSQVSGQGFAITTSNEHASVAAASFGSADARLYAMGRIGARLGRTPLPRIASLVFTSRLSGPLGPFKSVNYGVGDPPLGELAKRSVNLQVRPPFTQQVRPGRKGPSLLLNGLFGDTPFFAAAAYDSPEERETALSNMRALPAQRVFGRPVVLTAVAAQPDAPVPPRRITRAFERALGLSIGNITSSFDVKVDGPQITNHDAIEQRLVALNLLAGLSNERERQITGHNAPHYGLLQWAAPDGNGELTAVVAQARGVIPLAEVPAPVLRRFDRVALAQLAGLQPDQVIGYMQERARQLSHHTDLQSVVDEVVRHSRKIVAYNEHQPRRHVPADPVSLQDLIQGELDKREELARTIADSFDRPLPAGDDIYLLVDPRVRHPEMGPGVAGQDATIIHAPMRGNSPRVRVAIEALADEVPHPSAQHWWEATLAQWRDVFAARDVAFTGGVITGVLDAVAELLGHMFNEVWLD